MKHPFSLSLLTLTMSDGCDNEMREFSPGMVGQVLGCIPCTRMVKDNYSAHAYGITTPGATEQTTWRERPASRNARSVCFRILPTDRETGLLLCHSVYALGVNGGSTPSTY